MLQAAVPDAPGAINVQVKGPLPVMEVVPERDYEKKANRLKKTKKKLKKTKRAAKKRIRALERRIKKLGRKRRRRAKVGANGKLVEIGQSKKSRGLPELKRKEKPSILPWILLGWLLSRGRI